MPMAEFTHIDAEGRVRMVDVSAKTPTLRIARARGAVEMHPDTLERLRGGAIAKGNVLEAARIAGVMAAKRTADLIPMCHPLAISHVRVDFTFEAEASRIAIEAEVRLVGPTGVEMEALTAVAVAGLTIYDMCKAYDRQMRIVDILLAEKQGGKSGHFIRGDAPPA
jgi:cyclic pyranopterin phosphate synthase